MMMEATPQVDVQGIVTGVPFWWHSIDFGNGVFSKGHKTREILTNEVRNMQIPRLTGKTVLDIGAWDGFFSFEAERRGARQVTALDHFVWSQDLSGMEPFGLPNEGVEDPRPADQIPAIWQPEKLPGKIGFDTAHQLLQSKVRAVVGDWMAMDLAEIGTFDVVFYLGVLYHMQNPLESLKRLAQVTRELAIIETEAVAVAGHEDRAVCEFFEAADLANDPTNWWAPNMNALQGMCRAAGFRYVVHTVEPPRAENLLPNTVRRYRATVHAYK